MTITAYELKQFALEKGAELVGVAPVERFRSAPVGHHPGDILPRAKVVIVCAQCIPISTLEGPATAYHRAMEIIHAQLDQLACKIALFLEKAGGRAIPVPSDEPYRYWEAERSYGRGDLSHKHAAQAAGLGKIGKNSLLITPQLGSRVHLVSVVTDIDLAPDPPDPIPDWNPCPESCTICYQVCPVGAIGERQMVDQELCRKAAMEQLPRGMIIESCGACRRACPFVVVGKRRKLK
ncbi:MAG: epoxyqueuosine reductase [Candidatus Aminicenantes bacterium]|nr:MAG: epoxyqueuosine reductase [Candidatus Aminicenantes bacterium]